MSDDDFSLSDSPRFARSGHSNDGGKLTRRLDVPVSEELEEAVIALAAIAGVPRAEFARRLLERAVYGDLGMLRRVARERSGGPWDESPNGSGGR